MNQNNIGRTVIVHVVPGELQHRPSIFDPCLYISANGLNEETAPLKKYDGLTDLANGIRSGKVDFAVFGNLTMKEKN